MKRPVVGKPAELATKLKVLIHSAAGVGKTRLAATFPKPIIFDFEQSTMSIRDFSVDVVDRKEFLVNGVFQPNLLLEYLDWLMTPEAAQYETVVIDSMTELQEQFLEVVKPTKSDMRQAYGEWGDFVRKVMSKLRSLPKHAVVVTRTKMGEGVEGGGEMLYPQISPGSWTQIPALVDYGFYLQKKTSGFGPSAKVEVVLYTQSASAWTKTRSPLPAEIKNPTFQTIREAIAGGFSAAAKGS